MSPARGRHRGASAASSRTVCASMLRKMGHGACEFDRLCAVSDVGGGARTVCEKRRSPTIGPASTPCLSSSSLRWSSVRAVTSNSSGRILSVFLGAFCEKHGSALLILCRARGHFKFVLQTEELTPCHLFFFSSCVSIPKLSDWKNEMPGY